jgi:hypothetical protein
MVEVSRDGKRIYLTNSLYGSWDDQFYPDGRVLGLLLLPVVIMVSRGGHAPANLQPCQSTSRDSQPCSATWASRAR